MEPWSARWIEPVEADGIRGVQRPIYHLARAFDVTDAAGATLRITAHGIYEAFLNGERIGDRELTPGCTAYRKRLQVQIFDVSHLIRSGANVLGIALSDGWWRGQNGVGRLTNAYGSSVAALAELSISSGSGATTSVGTDASWVFAPSHVTAADLIAGEVHDMSARNDGWCSPGADRTSWNPVRVAEHDFDILCETIGPPVRRMRELPALSVEEVAQGRHIVDFGQVSNGWIRLTDVGPAGTELTIVYGEALSPAGDDIQIDALKGADPKRDGWDLGFQTDVVISAGDGATFEPRHSTKGFRYVRIDGHPGPLDPAALTSIVVHSDLQSIGGFECSNDDLNWLHTAADWSLRTNACDIPTDCPTRERAGWTGDWQIFIDTAAYLYDVTDFSRKWLMDVAAEQLPSGAVVNFVPDAADFSQPRVDWWKQLQGSAGWGDAIVHVPWELYRATGDAEVLKPYVDAMRRWVDFGTERAASDRHPDRAAARPAPAPHERYLWDSGFHFGEWNEPGFNLTDGEDVEEAPGVPALAARLQAQDHGPTATAFLFRSARELSAICALLGDDVTSEHYRELAENVRDAWRLEFIEPDGRVTPQTQPNLVRALAFDLVPSELRQRTADDLASLVRERDNHLGTGFLATPFLLPVLADNGHLDLAYNVLFQRTPPSWLAMRDRGATTIWEGWDAIDADGLVKESLNHFSMGAVIGFLHRYVAGLQVAEPGYRSVRIVPRPGGGITQASTYHEAPHGRVAVGWAISDGVGEIDVVLPHGVRAELILPTGATEHLEGGQHHRTWKADL